MVEWISWINEKLGRAVSWLTLALVILVFGNVCLRYLFNTPLAWAKELEWHLFALIFLFGAAYTLKHDRHVRVDLFYDKQEPKVKNQVNFWGTLLFLLPWCLVLIYTGWQSAVDAYRVGERSAEAGGLPNLWLIQFAIPVGLFFLFLQGLALLVASRPGQDVSSLDPVNKVDEEPS
ncbi:MAG: TRAP transporter small permease subunit [Bacteroidota bacterium]